MASSYRKKKTPKRKYVAKASQKSAHASLQDVLMQKERGHQEMGFHQPAWTSRGQLYRAEYAFYSGDKKRALGLLIDLIQKEVIG